MEQRKGKLRLEVEARRARLWDDFLLWLLPMAGLGAALIVLLHWWGAALFVVLVIYLMLWRNK